MFDLTIVGVGLIGGSIAAAARQRGLARRILGVGRSRERLQAAVTRGLIDQATTDLPSAAKESRFLIFCSPVDRIVEGVQTALPHCQPGTLITDAGSVKGIICEQLTSAAPTKSGHSENRVHFIGSHPLAGSEKQGYEYADSHLFQGRVCVVTPDESTPEEPLNRLTRFWEDLGSTVVRMSAREHDHILAQTSHLPHVVAAALASTLADSSRPFAATGFRDTTRIASGDPDLWVAILLNNPQAVVEHLDACTAGLEKFRAALMNRDAAGLKKLLQIAKTNRDALEGSSNPKSESRNSG